MNYLGELPACYERLAERAVDPLKTGRAVRVPPGSRVLVSPEADALMRTAADWAGGWAARVRAVPGLQLARHGHAHGSQAQVAADCVTLAAHHVPLLALPAAVMARTWTWTGGAMPGWVEEETGDLERLRGGDGWVTCLPFLSGEDAALELFSLRRDIVRLLRETAAPRELLDGVPCRECEAMSSLEVLPAPPPDPSKPEPAFCRCSVASCRAEMTRREYDQWTARYASYVRGAGVTKCARCLRGDCGACSWKACGCRAAGHAAA